MRLKKIFARLGAGLWLLLSCVVASAQFQLPYSMHTLPNGLTVILHEDHTVPMVAVNVWYHVGSGYEKPGKTGFAHLFEHIMFEGSANVKEGDFDNLLEAVGGNNNGSTTTDRTNYYETLPSSSLDLALFLESDRMGYLLDAMTPGKVDGQRDVVKNERRQSYENRPYGLAWEALAENLYPEGHPYHWTTIGSMADLSAASFEDVAEFFKKYYCPNNASLVIAGDIDPAQVLQRVSYWFAEIPPCREVLLPAVPAFELETEKRIILEDKVQLPRVYIAYPTPAIFEPGDAELSSIASILTDGKNSRLYRKLVYELGIAQDVQAFQDGNLMGSSFIIIATARPGHSLPELVQVIDAEIDLLKATPPTLRELQRVQNQMEVSMIQSLQSNERKADQLNQYYYLTGNPDWFNEDLLRFKALTPDDLSAMAQRYLPSGKRVVLSIVPKSQIQLAVPIKN